MLTSPLPAPSVALTRLAQDGLWRQNPGLVQMLGLCPVLAVSTTLVNGTSLGLATALVTALSGMAVAAVRHGDAQAMLAELYQLQYPIRNNQLSELTITELPERFGLGFAIRPEQASLAGVLDQSLMTLNDRQVDELVQRWRRLVVNQQEGVTVRQQIQNLLDV